MPFMHEKPHRLPRECYRGIVTVSFTACIDGRTPVFTKCEVVDTFLAYLRDAIAEHECRALIYCFMPDHLHVLLHGESATADTWAAMVSFKQKTGFWFGQNGRYAKWQKDFHDHIIRANEDLAAHVRYIADNPVRWGLVERWFDYPFTGAIGYSLNDILADVAPL